MFRGFRVSNISDYLPHPYHQSVSRVRLLCSYTSIDGDRVGRRPLNGSGGDDSGGGGGGGDVNYHSYDRENERMSTDNTGRRQQVVSREKFDSGFGGRRGSDYSGGRTGSDRLRSADRSNQRMNHYPNNKPNPDTGRGGGVNKTDFFTFGNEEKHQILPSHQGERQQGDDAFLEKFKLGIDQGKKKPHSNELPGSGREGEEGPESKGAEVPEPPPQDADEIFQKMKETGLIPNAVAMLHGLCNDGLVQEAMKLFGLMREKGTIPEVVIYTAVVEGFCKAQKLDDAKRIFRKMQNSGISANAFSYSILVQGLLKGKRLDDALEFSVEMLEAGHFPNLATFIGLVDGFCKERSLEAAQVMIETLRHKGFFFDEKAVREFLDKKGPFLPIVWEAILRKKSSRRCF